MNGFASPEQDTPNDPRSIHSVADRMEVSPGSFGARPAEPVNDGIAKNSSGCHKWLIALLLAAGALRCLVAGTLNGDWKDDADGYIAHALKVADGKGFVGPFTNRPTAFRPPAYPILLAVGPCVGIPIHGWAAALNVIAGTITVWFTVRLARSCGCGRGSALLAGALVAVDPLLLRYTAMPMTEVLSAALLTAAQVQWQRALSARNCLSASELPPPDIAVTDAGKQFGVRVTCGILLGIAALVRPVAIVVTALLTAAALVDCLRHVAWRSPDRNARLTSAIVRSLIPATVAGLVMCPWIVRNLVHFGRLIPATTHGGYTLALGNNPQFYRDVVSGGDTQPWDGQRLEEWQRQTEQQAIADGVARGDEVEADEWYYRQARTAVRDQPLMFLQACVQRLRRFWSVRPAVAESIPAILLLMIGAWYSMMWLAISAAALFQVCGYGKIAGQDATLRHPAHPTRVFERGRRMHTAALWITIAAFLLIHAIYWTNARMRAPVMPILAVLTTVGIRWLMEWFGTGLRRFRNRLVD